MTGEADWAAATWEGNRLRQNREFQALSFREKLRRMEDLAETAEHIRLAARGNRGAKVADDGQNEE